MNFVGCKMINTTKHRDVGDPRTKGGEEEGRKTGKGEELLQPGLNRRGGGLSGACESYPTTLP